MLPCIEISF